MYSSEVGRQHKVAIVVAIDQSSSMAQKIEVASRTMSKAKLVSEVVGELIDEMLLRSRYDGLYRDYYDVAILGYSGDGVYSLISDHPRFVTISELSQRRVEREHITFRCTLLNGDVVVVPHGISKWVEPRSVGATPMCKMMECVATMLEEWCAEPHNRHSFPPIVVNISDGMLSDATEERLMTAVERIRQTGTDDGKSLLMNIHISSSVGGESMICPCIEEVDRDNRHAMLLARISSNIPQSMEHMARLKRASLSRPPYLAMGYNTSPAEFVSLLNIGSRSDNVQHERNRQLCLQNM